MEFLDFGEIFQGDEHAIVRLKTNMQMKLTAKNMSVNMCLN